MSTPSVHSGNSMMVVEICGRSPRGRAGDWGGRGEASYNPERLTITSIRTTAGIIG